MPKLSYTTGKHKLPGLDLIDVVIQRDNCPEYLVFWALPRLVDDMCFGLSLRVYVERRAQCITS